MSAIDNPNMIRLYGELSLFGERQIVKQRNEEAKKDTVRMITKLMLLAIYVKTKKNTRTTRTLPDAAIDLTI